MTSIQSILIVDDSRDLLELLRRQLKSRGLNPMTADNVVDAIEVLENTKIDLLISDINMPGIGGEQLIRYVSQHYQHLPVLVMTGYPDVNSAVNLMKQGVIEYLIKPFPADDLFDAIARVAPIRKTEAIESITAAAPLGIIGNAPKMQALYQIIERTKSNKATVLISGESGTGKELVARAIHYQSDFSSAPFVPVNCGAIPESLIESELFGHVKGSFTGAINNRTGFFQSAHGGTLFLDEITNTSLEVQAKLLRAIQEKEVTPLGSNTSQKIDVRIISATNVDIHELIRQKKFREDLFYRLNVISLEIPALREREGDVPLLIQYFVNKFCAELSLPTLKFERKALTTLEQYSWPGNVRELENFIQRLVIMTDQKVSMADIPSYMKMSADIFKGQQEFITLREFEKKYILKVLRATNNNKTEAARILQIDRKTLREKIK